MKQFAYAVSVSREDLPAYIGATESLGKFSRFDCVDLASRSLGKREVIVGHWRVPDGDAFPDFIVVNDGEADDTSAWMSAYLNGYSPISQWCRVLSQSSFNRIVGNDWEVEYDGSLGAWVGLILAECGGRLSPNQALKDVSGFAALAGASFAAARCVGVWTSGDQLDMVADRYDDLTQRLGANNRGTLARNLSSLWKTIASARGSRKLDFDAAVFPFNNVFRELFSATRMAPENIRDIAFEVGRQIEYPELERCAVGPQSSRVDYLDKIAYKISKSQKYGDFSQALLGFGASLVDPGVSVAPDLLRRHFGNFSAAPAWAGAFAGAWYPARVMSDHGGLGRIVAKELRKSSDLFSKPLADISYDELSRWIGTGHSAGVSVRGLVGRSINVELISGVSIPVSVTRADQSKADLSSINRQRSLELDLAAKEQQQKGGDGKREETLESLSDRIAALESKLASHIARVQKKALPKNTRG